MAVMYYWSKYNIVNITIDNSSWQYPSNTSRVFAELYTSYSFDSVSNTYSTTGQKHPYNGTQEMPVGTTGYSATSPSQLTKYVTTVLGYSGSFTSCSASDKYAAQNTKQAVRGTLIQSDIVAAGDAYPINGAQGGFWYVRGALANAIPTITLNTPNNSTLYENDTFKIDGSAVDPDVGNIVNVKYQINSEAIRAIAVNISTGAAMPYNKQLLFKAGILHDDATAVTGPLNAGVAHTLKVWAEDDQGGKSAEQIRTFYVVPNRPPALTVYPFTEQSDMINNDTITLSGVSSDPDGNDVKVAYKLNSNAAVQIHSGVAGPWTFDLSLKSLKDGENIIVVEVTDTYDFKTSKTIKLNKTANLTPLSTSVQRYKIVPPSGSARGVLLWIQRDVDQEVSAEISMTTGSEQEQHMPMTLSNTAPVSAGIVEDEFTFQADAAKENIYVKLNITGTGAVTLISGVLS